MNSDILYPDNRNRGNRVKQLVTQITTMQSEARLNKSTVTDQMKVIESKFPDVLQAFGMRSLAELKQKLLETLPPDLKEKYLEMVRIYEEDNANDNQVMNVVEMVITVAAGTALTAKVFEVIASANVAAAINYVLRALIVLTEDIQAAQRLLKFASALISTIKAPIELGETTLKLVKLVKIIGEVVSVIGVFIDGILIVIAAVEGAKQRENLQAAINDLVYRRFSSHSIVLMGDIYAQYISSLYLFVLKMKRKSDIDEIVEETIDDLKKGLEAVNFDRVLADLKNLDRSDSTTWNNEDPSDYAIRKWWVEEGDPTKYDGPIPDKHA